MQDPLARPVLSVELKNFTDGGGGGELGVQRHGKYDGNAVSRVYTAIALEVTRFESGGLNE